MVNFKINFQLQDIDKIIPFGAKQDYLSWFGLTDSLLWIEVGDQTIYEYTKEAQNYFGRSTPPYDDYQLSRFLEDFFETFQSVCESIPESFYRALDHAGKYQEMAEKWLDVRVGADDVTDEEYWDFVESEYDGLMRWYLNRTLDSGHLVGGPLIGCFRCGDLLRIQWDGDYRLESGNSIWTAPKGSYEMPYELFVSEVRRFLDSFFKAMDMQVERATAKAWGDVKLDKALLWEEHERRRREFYLQLSYLETAPENEDWERIKGLVVKMKQEIA